MIEGKRFTEVDGLRGIAALLVVLTHFGESLTKLSVPAAVSVAANTWFYDLFSPGRVGVVAFFCISGFVIPYSFGGRNPALSFPINRFFRIYPAFWLTICLASLVFTALGMRTITAPQFLVNATLLHRMVGVPYILTVDWTLLIEMLFYGICYALFLGKRVHSFPMHFAAMIVLLGIAVVGGVYRWYHPMSSLPIGIPTYLAAMHFGALTRMRVIGYGPIATKLYPAALFFLVFGASAANTLAYHHTKTELIGVVAANTGYLGGVSLFLVCVYAKLFTSSAWQFLGKISYSVYLLHTIILALVISLWPLFSSWVMAVLILMPAYFTVVVFCSFLSQRYVEQPSVALGRRVVKRLESRTRLGSERTT
ncbi:acyltransferase family protein [Sphingomonas sp. R1]|uniref:acyltransferase family protein n=1 Tax=Sphingomonas sp. R1 TaxID=399176 RepID=UPI0022241602|nr:acyltransferase [Sphingomonas sp. R1]UYY79016.1 acyltransferase [Sphingomonas sp. R1]